MFVGVTLLFKFKKDFILYGALKSYTIDCDGVKDLQNKVLEKVNMHLIHYPTYEYLGIDDVFTVSNKAQVGEMLGRTSYFEIDNKEQAYDLLESEKVIQDIVSKNEYEKYFNAKLLYYYNGEEKFIFSILTIGKLSKELSIIQNISSLANSDLLKMKIVEFSIDNIVIEDIEYIGIEDFAIIDENIDDGGAFQNLYNSEFDKEEDISLTTDEIEDICYDIFLKK